MSLYLLKRSSIYYFRRAIPSELQATLGRTEFVFSLKTKDMAEAKRRRTTAIAASDEALATASLNGAGAVSGGSEQFVRQESNGLQFSMPTSAKTKLSLEMQADFSGWERLLELWQSDRKAAQKTQDTYRRVARQFHEFARKSPSQITKKDVSDFKNDLLLIKKKTNANVYEILKKLRSLLGVAVENDLLEYNPASSVRVTVKRGKRQPFSHEDLLTIFASPVFSKGLRPTEGKGEAAFFIPLMMALHGMRPREVAQGRVKDVQTHTIVDVNGHQSSWPFFHVTDDEDDVLTVKNTSSIRFVPIHPLAIEMGFIEYLQSLRDRNIYWLFPDLIADKYGNKSAKWSEWFNEYLREICGIVDKHKVLYSFRHSWKDLARDSGMPDELQRAIMGHTGKGVADSYGSGFGLHRLAEAIQMVRVPGLPIQRSTA